MTDKERIEQLELYLTEALVRQEENSIRLQQNTQQLVLLESRLTKIATLLGIVPNELDSIQEILKNQLLIRQIYLRQN